MTRTNIIILSSVVAVILIIVVLIIYRPKPQEVITSAPPTGTGSGSGTGTGSGSELPDCSTINKVCRSKCINKWWIPIVGITEYQKCMDKCKSANPCI